MDKLTNFVADYKANNDQKLISKIQNIITPLIIKLLIKWKFDRFPKPIYQNLFDEAKTVILFESLQRYDSGKGSKFSSFYATSLNFYLRAQYMKFFQHGKPIRKRWGLLHETSLDYEYENGGTLGDTLTLENNVRNEIDSRLVVEKINQLNSKEQVLLKALYISDISVKNLALRYHINYSALVERKDIAMSNLRKLVVK